MSDASEIRRVAKEAARAWLSTPGDVDRADVFTFINMSDIDTGELSKEERMDAAWMAIGMMYTAVITVEWPGE